MERQVKWKAPVKEGHGTKLVRESKCGRFRNVSKNMASGRNGYFNARAYEPQRADGTRIGRELQDKLSDALDVVESENDPNWEP